jgi:hypothetical protein
MECERTNCPERTLDSNQKSHAIGEHQGTGAFKPELRASETEAIEGERTNTLERPVY